MNKLKIFLSSRVNSPITALEKDFSLEGLRKYIRDELESEIFLQEKILEVVINESNFNSTISKDAFDNCMATMRSCQIIIILYNGEAGWSVTGNDSTNGICHEEFLLAMNEFSEMTFILDISAFFIRPSSGGEKKRDDAFEKDFNESFTHKEIIKAKTVAELKTRVLKQIKQYILSAIEKSFDTQKRIVSGSTVFGPTLDWSKLTYSERQEKLKSVLETILESAQTFNSIIKAYHAIPDNMSVSDARNLVGRPFINEHHLTKNKKATGGVIHFVAVYGNVTEIQFKNLVGYPDLTVIKAPFGFYLWEQNVHIQMFFLKNCINPQTVKTRLSELINWITSSKEQSKIIGRAEGRYSILKAINGVKNIV